MNCIKCGREVPEGQMFCQECKLPTVAVPVAPPPQKKAVKKKKRKVKRKKFDRAKIIRRLTAALTVVSVLFAGLVTLVSLELKGFSDRKEALRQQEANVALRQKEADNRDARIKELEDYAAQLELELAQAQDTIKALQPEEN